MIMTVYEATMKLADDYYKLCDTHFKMAKTYDDLAATTREKALALSIKDGEALVDVENE